MSANAKVVPLKSPVLNHRVDVVVLYTVFMANPQGDPDNKNWPRTDDDGYGFVTPMCPKTKFRNYCEDRGMEMWIAKRAVKSRVVAAVAVKNQLPTFDGGDDEEDEETTDEEPKKAKKSKAKKSKAKKSSNGKPTHEQTDDIVKAMSAEHVDYRTFGGVITKPYNEGVRGPVQISFAVSVEPITILDSLIGCRAVASEKEAKTKDQTFGNIAVVPFGLYKFSMSISAADAKRTGFTEADLEMVLDGIEGMFENDVSTVRNGLAVEKMVIFRHDSPLGSHPRHKLINSVEVERRDRDNGTTLSLPLTKTQAEALPSARSINDYEITVNTDGIPDSVKVEIR